MSRSGYAIVVDDKSYGREAGVEVMHKLGYPEERIIVARYGDEALDKYNQLKQEGKPVDIVLTDYHMDVVTKPHEDGLRWYKTPIILDGKTLTQQILRVDPMQKVIIVSGAMTGDVLDKIENAGMRAVLYKRKPEDRKFAPYVEAIGQVIDTGTLDEKKYSFLTHTRSVSEKREL